MTGTLSLQDARKIERYVGKPLLVALPPTYQEKRVGRYNVQMPVVRFKCRGDKRWREFSGGMVQ